MLRVVAAQADEPTFDALQALARQTQAFLQKRQLYEALTFARTHRELERILSRLLHS